MIKAPDVTSLYVLCAFIASFWILKRFLFGPLLAILEERDREARSAERVHAESLAELQKTITRAEADLARARSEALAVRERLRAEGRAHWERKLEEARAAAQSALDSATAEIRSEAARAAAELPRSARELARGLAEKILGRKIAA